MILVILAYIFSMKKFALISILFSIYYVSYGQTFFDSLVIATNGIVNDQIVYDPSYFSIDYPNGDIPAGLGVCTDVVIRAYRAVGIDLQKEVHEDMKANFNSYPKKWGHRTTDKNIDHRRVPNLMTYFKRKGAEKAITLNPQDYYPGDIVCWDLGGGITHIGIVVESKSNDGLRNMIVHNIGQGQVKEDVLFSYKIIGHYRYNLN